MKIHATLSTRSTPRHPSNRLTVQNPAIRTLHMILPSYLSLSHVVVHFPSLTREMFTRHSRHSFEPEDEGCNFDEDPRWTEGACTEPGHAEDSFPPMCPAGAHRRLDEKGPRQKPGNQENHRPVRSTVNACSMPPLTTILASCRSRARPATASNEHRDFCLRTRSEDLTRERPDVLVSEDTSDLFKLRARTILIQFDLVRGAFNVRSFDL